MNFFEILFKFFNFFFNFFLSRATSGIRNQTLIVNFPGSKNAVVECFEAIQHLIPHAIELISDQKSKTEQLHKEMQKENSNDEILSSSDLLNASSTSSVMEEIIIEDLVESAQSAPQKHVCPHKTAKSGDEFDRNSPFPMVEVEKALGMVFEVSLVEKT